MLEKASGFPVGRENRSDPCVRVLRRRHMKGRLHPGGKHTSTPVAIPYSNPGLFRCTSLCECASLDYVCTFTCTLGVCPCVHVTVDSTLSTAVDISTVVMGALFSSRCRQYHLLVMLHRHLAHSKKKKKKNT